MAGDVVDPEVARDRHHADAVARDPQEDRRVGAALVALVRPLVGAEQEDRLRPGGRAGEQVLDAPDAAEAGGEVVAEDERGHRRRGGGGDHDHHRGGEEAQPQSALGRLADPARLCRRRRDAWRRRLRRCGPLAAGAGALGAAAEAAPGPPAASAWPGRAPLREAAPAAPGRRRCGSGGRRDALVGLGRLGLGAGAQPGERRLLSLLAIGERDGVSLDRLAACRWAAAGRRRGGGLDLLLERRLGGLGLALGLLATAGVGGWGRRRVRLPVVAPVAARGRRCALVRAHDPPPSSPGMGRLLTKLEIACL